MHAARRFGRKETQATVAASSKFGAFKPESEREVRTHKVEMNPVLEAMKKAWKETRGRIGLNFHDEEILTETIELISALKYTAKDVESFSAMLAGFQKEGAFSEKAGIFLSALINCSEEETFVIHTANLTKPIHYLGIHNEKNITVKGDIGDYVGFEMQSGSIKVEGNARDYVGWLMENGKISVEGDAGSDVGESQSGGVIRINGTIGSLGDISNGKIFHKGKLIVDK